MINLKEKLWYIETKPGDFQLKHIDMLETFFQCENGLLKILSHFFLFSPDLFIFNSYTAVTLSRGIDLKAQYKRKVHITSHTHTPMICL